MGKTWKRKWLLELEKQKPKPPKKKREKQEIKEYKYDLKMRKYEWNKNMKKDELIDVAKKYKIKVKKSMTVKEIIKLIEYHEEFRDID